MSIINEDYEVSICANCGKGEEESIKLKACMACKLVKYCSRECQIAHRPQHKKACKKRAAELHDEELFKQPPLAEDCPICFIRLPTFIWGSKYMTCCGKIICSGCIYAPRYDNQGNEVDNEICPFCRAPHPDTEEEAVRQLNKRMEVDDAQAFYNLGCYHRDGKCGFPQDYRKALELYHRAGELGEASAYCSIGCYFDNGEGVVVDKKKAIHYYEIAAIGGDTNARINLGANEAREGNMDRSLKHYTIAAGAGYSDSLKWIQNMYSDGHASKDDYTKALQAYQTYLSEIKSPQRDKAAAADERYRYY